MIHKKVHSFVWICFAEKMTSTYVCTSNISNIYCPQRSWGKVMFLHVSVILFTTGFCLSACWDIPPGPDTPRTRHPPKEQTPQEQTLQEQTPPQGQTPAGPDTPQEQTPPEPGLPPHRSACWEIRVTSGRYASYWNAYLLVY